MTTSTPATVTLGFDAQGREVAVNDGVIFLLTPCCSATGKGTVNCSTGLCCRGCYEELYDWEYGMSWTVGDPTAPIIVTEVAP